MRKVRYRFSMRKLTTTLCLTVALLFGCSGVCKSLEAANFYKVATEISGSSYNEVWKNWVKRDVSIHVGQLNPDNLYIDANKLISENNGQRFYVLFEAETGLGSARVYLEYTSWVRKRLEGAIKKSIKWAEIAKDNKADVSKPLRCFGDDKYDQCANDGRAREKNQMGFSFFATNGGKQTSLIITIIDFDNSFRSETIYLDLLGMKQLMTTILKIPDKFKYVQKQYENRALFK